MLIDSNMVISGFVSKIANDCVDILKDKIKDADRNRKADEQNIETRIYQVTIDALNEFPYNQYKKEEKVYDAAESILKGFKGNQDDKVEAVRAGLKMLVPQVTSETCMDFLKILHHEICIDKNDILYKEIILLQGEQTFESVCEGFDVSNKNDEETHEKLERVIEGIKNIDKKIDGIEYDETKHYEIPIKNRAEEYADKWEENVFLNNFNKRDKNAGVNIKLKDIYLEKHLPHYVWKMGDEPLNDLRNLLSEYIVDNNDKKMLLILGQPGIGKSTLITWIMVNLAKKEEQILVYQFASDLKNVNWQGDDIINEILNALKLRYDELENRVLIFDGFDEIHTSVDRERIINKLYQDIKKMNYLKKFSLIITCRENYIAQTQLTGCDYITLQAWDENQIKSFCDIYEEKSTEEITKIESCKISETKIIKILEKKEIFGIPLILYMVLALNVAIEDSSSIVDVYDQIFLLGTGGIYDRCIRNSKYGEEHRINKADIKDQIHKISQRVAFWIFENNSEKAFIPQMEYEMICDTTVKEAGKKKKSGDTKRDVLIGNYFKLIKHCEGIGTDELYFAHRSIYEYFVAVYFFESIYKLQSKEEVAGKLGELLKDGHLTEQILVFIKCKFDSMKRYNLAGGIKDIFNIMLRDSMIYHIGEPVLNVMDREMNIFSNMLEVVHLWNPQLGEVNEKIVSYFAYNNRLSLNLRGVKLSGLKLLFVYLYGADLREADLSGTDLSGANLNDADLSGANLRKAKIDTARMIGANLSGVNLSEENLRGIDLGEANLSRANLVGADLSGADLAKTNLIGADLSRANLSGVNISGAHLEEANLSEAHLEGAYLGKMDMYGYLEEVHLERACLKGTIFDEEQADRLCAKYDLYRSRVYFSKIRKVISYNSYRRYKQNV